MRFARKLAFTILADEIFTTKAQAPDTPQKRRRVTLALADGAQLQLDVDTDVARQIVAAGGGDVEVAIMCEDVSLEPSDADAAKMGERRDALAAQRDREREQERERQHLAERQRQRQPDGQPIVPPPAAGPEAGAKGALPPGAEGGARRGELPDTRRK